MKIITDYKLAKKLLTRSIIGGSSLDDKKIETAVKEIIEKIRTDGDKALFSYTERFDGAKLKSLEVTKAEIQHAHTVIRKQSNGELYDALKFAAKRIKKFHKTGMQKYGKGFFKEGLGQQVTALERVGIYIPGGTASYPSTVLMTAIPARVAGVKEIIMVTPCGKDGKIPVNTLVAADIAGVDRIFKVGGAQAVAALAFGTKSIPRVDKICGPGNIYVMVAKRLVYGIVGIDALQGPSEVVIIADSTSDPSLCAADLIAQSEHDAMASSVFITTSESLAGKVQIEICKQLEKLSRSAIAIKALRDNGKMVIVKNMTEAMELANLYSPEHLSLLVKDPFKYVEKFKNAGCICAGRNSPVVLGDYVAGPSHALPTGGSARFSSPLIVQDFLKISSIIALADDEIVRIGPPAILVAENEGLTGHANAIKLRLNKKGKSVKQ
jgi:histidinol dehydrogenase